MGDESLGEEGWAGITLQGKCVIVAEVVGVSIRYTLKIIQNFSLVMIGWVG